MLTIKLTRGLESLIDSIDADFSRVKCHTHISNGVYYACDNRKRYLHRVILSRILGRELTRKEEVDHINNNTLDNRRENLRLANRVENCQNTRKKSTNKSGYKGVHFHKQSGKWRAQIKVGSKYLSLGLFLTPEIAAEAYKNAAIKYHGEFANFD